MASEEFYGTTELAEYLDVPVATVRKWRFEGHGPRSLKVGRHVRYRRADVEQWLDTLAPEPRGAA